MPLSVTETSSAPSRSTAVTATCGRTPGATYLTALPTRLSSSWRTSAPVGRGPASPAGPRSAAGSRPRAAARRPPRPARVRSTSTMSSGRSRATVKREQVVDEVVHLVRGALHPRQHRAQRRDVDVPSASSSSRRLSVQPRTTVSGFLRSWATTPANDDQLVALLVLAGDVAQGVDDHGPRVAVEAVDRDRGDLEGALLAGPGADPDRLPDHALAVAGAGVGHVGERERPTVVGDHHRLRRAGGAGSQEATVAGHAVDGGVADGVRVVGGDHADALGEVLDHRGEQRGPRVGLALGGQRPLDCGPSLLGAEGDRERGEHLGDQEALGDRGARQRVGLGQEHALPAQRGDHAHGPEHEGEQHAPRAAAAGTQPRRCRARARTRRAWARARRPPTPAALVPSSTATVSTTRQPGWTGPLAPEPLAHRRPTRSAAGRAARVHRGRGSS